MHESPNAALSRQIRNIRLLPPETARGIRWVLTDIDDTMTRDGKLVPAAYAALCSLKEAGLSVVAVTGRSAGWGQVHLQEWPLDGVITENGAVSYFPGGSLADPSALRNTEPALLRAARASYLAVPRAKPAQDNHLRLYDYAIDHSEYVRPPLTSSEVDTIVGIFEKEGCTAKPSSIHINCWVGSFNKRDASIRFLSEREGYRDDTDREKVLYVGDALNDEVMFAHFPNACAVANVDVWLDRMQSLPSWISGSGYGDGFAEIAGVLLEKRLTEVPN